MTALDKVPQIKYHIGRVYWAILRCNVEKRGICAEKRCIREFAPVFTGAIFRIIPFFG